MLKLPIRSVYSGRSTASSGNGSQQCRSQAQSSHESGSTSFEPPALSVFSEDDVTADDSVSVAHASPPPTKKAKASDPFPKIPKFKLKKFKTESPVGDPTDEFHGIHDTIQQEAGSMPDPSYTEKWHKLIGAPSALVFQDNWARYADPKTAIRGVLYRNAFSAQRRVVTIPQNAAVFADEQRCIRQQEAAAARMLLQSAVEQHDLLRVARKAVTKSYEKACAAYSTTCETAQAAGTEPPSFDWTPADSLTDKVQTHALKSCI